MFAKRLVGVGACFENAVRSWLIGNGSVTEPKWIKLSQIMSEREQDLLSRVMALDKALQKCLE
jgi:hypothetical protein